MKSIHEFWSVRLSSHLKEVHQYLRYMLNNHLLLVLMFLIGAGVFKYQKWLHELPPDFPAAFLISIVLSLTTTFSPIRTLLKEPDIVFLLPAEKELNHYFRRAFTYSYATQLIPTALCLLVLAPLYFRSGEGDGASYVLFIIQLLGIKFWNQLIQWKMTHFPETLSQLADISVRFAVNFTVIFLAMKESGLTFLLYGIMLIVLYYFFRVTKNKPLKWEYLISQENRRKQTFYRTANLFTDVPKLKHSVKRRKWLDWMLSFVRYEQTNTFLYMFARAFIRAGDYLGLYARLFIIGAVLAVIWPVSYFASIILPAGVLFLTGSQLLGLYRHYDALLMPDLYPVSFEMKKKSFLRFLFIILFIDLAAFSIVLLTQTSAAAVLTQLAVNGSFVYVFVYGYVSKKLTPSLFA